MHTYWHSSLSSRWSDLQVASKSSIPVIVIGILYCWKLPSTTVLPNRPKQTSLNFPPPPRLSVGEGWELVRNIQGYYCSAELGASRSPRHISKYWFAQLRSLPSSFGKETWHVNLLPYLPIPSLHQCESPKAKLKNSHAAPLKAVHILLCLLKSRELIHQKQS